MSFDIDELVKKITEVSLRKTKKVSFKLSDKEEEFISFVFDSIINSDAPEFTTSYLANIYELTTSEIKLIRNFYYLHYATNEEKQAYKKMQDINMKKRRARGFIDITAMISIVIIIFTIGISLAALLYNLL